MTLLLLAGFIAWEFRAPAPLLALRLFAGGGFRATALVALAYGLGLFGTTYLIPVFVQDVAGYSPSRAGALVRQLGGAIGVNLLAVLLEWRLGVHGAGGATTAFQECFWVVTIAFAAATAAAWSIRRHRPDNNQTVLR